MNKHQGEGLGKQIKGAVKEVAGKVTGDKILQGEGKIEKGIGRVQEKFGDAKQRHDIKQDSTRRPV